MVEKLGSDLSDNVEITLGVLNAVGRNSAVTQRGIAKDLGIALGLANAYLRRCATKGLIKISEAPANRYAYYLTPKGFAEKSRLTAAYLGQSFNLFRRARREYAEIFAACVDRGCRRVAFVGNSDLAEIALLCARDYPIVIVGSVSAVTEQRNFTDVAVAAALAALDRFDAVVITDLTDPQGTYEALNGVVRYERVFVPSFLNVSETPASTEFQP